MKGCGIIIKIIKQTQITVSLQFIKAETVLEVRSLIENPRFISLIKKIMINATNIFG